MSGGKALYEQTLQTKKVKVIAMKVLAGGGISPKEAVDYVNSLPNIASILIGASRKNNIKEMVTLINTHELQPQFTSL
jgi:triosephosphate isomerase